MWCSYHITTSDSDADCRARRRKQAACKGLIAATGSLRIQGICSAFNLPGEDDQPKNPYICFTATEVHPTAAIAVEQAHNEETWPFSSLSASRLWPFEERAKPAISFLRSEKLGLLLHERENGR